VADAVVYVAAIERAFTPNAEAHQAYGVFYDNWRRVYQRSLEMVEDGLVRPLWRAAGTL